MLCVSRFVGRRGLPSTLRGVCVLNGYASTMGIRLPGAAAPFRRNLCVNLDAAKRRDAFFEDYKGFAIRRSRVGTSSSSDREWRNYVVRPSENCATRCSV